MNAMTVADFLPDRLVHVIAGFEHANLFPIDCATVRFSAGAFPNRLERLTMATAVIVHEATADVFVADRVEFVRSI